MSWRARYVNSAARLDVLETELPRENCQERGCNRSARYETPTPFGTRWFCARCRPARREHYRIVQRILSIPPRDILGGE